ATESAACSTTVRSTRRAMRTSPSCSAGRSSRSGWAPCCATAAVCDEGYRPDPLDHGRRGAVRPVCIAAPIALVRTSGSPLAEQFRDRRHVGRRADRKDSRALGDPLDESGKHLTSADLDESCDTLPCQILDRLCPLYWSRDLSCQLRPQILGQRERT